MSTTVDRIQLEIAVKHDKTRQEIAQVTDSITAETDALKKMKDEKRKAMKKYKDESHPEVVKATRAYEEQAQKVETLRRRKDELRASLKVEGLSISELLVTILPPPVTLHPSPKSLHPSPEFGASSAT